MSESAPDPVSMDDTELILAMGLHDDVCDCAWCLEWHRRRGSTPALTDETDD